MRLDITGQKYGKLTVESFSHVASQKTYWKCSCECGGSKTVRSNDLRTGKTTSCGCNMKESSKKNQKKMAASNKLPKGESAFNLIYAQYRHSANKRGYSFTLTKEQLKKLTKSKCHYCGSDPDNLFEHRRGNGGYLYNGVDRVDNTKGYDIDNVVTCCKACNLAKHTRTYSTFIKWVKKTYMNLKDTGRMIEVDEEVL
jgi:5-methylcytosine-specific restriction endonuclease McrA